MKKIILGLALVLGVGIVSANAQSNASTAKLPSSATSPVITVSEKDNTYNFGTVPQGTPVTHVFTIRNTGKAPLVLASVAASCGCTTPEWTKEPIAPGASTPIKVTYNAATPGEFTKNVTISSNASATPSYVLYIKGEVKPVQQAAAGGPATQSAAPKKN